MIPSLAKLVNRPQDVAENEAGTNRKRGFRFKFRDNVRSLFEVLNQKFNFGKSCSKRKMKMKNLKNEAIPSFELDK